MKDDEIKRYILAKFPGIDIRIDKSKVIRMQYGEYRGGIEKRDDKYFIYFGNVSSDPLNIELLNEKYCKNLKSGLDALVKLFKDYNKGQ